MVGKKGNNMRTEEFIATVHEVMTIRDYTLIEYIKGGLREWCVCYKYDSTLLEWENGTYCYTSVEAITEFVRKVNPYIIKSNEERNSEISYSRMSEIASLCIGGLLEDDVETASAYMREECAMSEDEAKWFGIEDKLFPKRYKIVQACMTRTQEVKVYVAIPQEADIRDTEDYLDMYNFEVCDYDIDSNDWEIDEIGSDVVREDFTATDVLNFNSKYDIYNIDDFEEER